MDIRAGNSQPSNDKGSNDHQKPKLLMSGAVLVKKDVPKPEPEPIMIKLESTPAIKAAAVPEQGHLHPVIEMSKDEESLMQSMQSIQS